MKKIVLMIAAAAVVASCSRDELDLRTGDTRLNIAAECLTALDAQTRVELSAMGVNVPDKSTFRTVVWSPDVKDVFDDGFYNVWTSLSEFNREKYEFVPEVYRVKLSSKPVSYKRTDTGATVTAAEALRLGLDPTVLIPIVDEGVDKPYFEGYSANVTVEAQQTATAKVTAAPANSVVTIQLTDRFCGYFANGASFTIKTAKGSTFTWSSGDAQQYWWVCPQGLTITGKAVKQSPSPGIFDPEEVTFTHTVADSEVAKRTLYRYTFDVSTAGSAKVTITVNDTPLGTIDLGEEELNDSKRE